MHKEYVLVCSLGNHLTSNGGVSKVLREHSNMLLQENISYIVIFPIVKKIGFFEVYGWGLVNDNKFVGVYNCEGIKRYLINIQCMGFNCRQIHIHHLLKVRLNELQNIIDLYDCDIKFYLHDYLAICKQGNLLKNGQYYCESDNAFCTNQDCQFCDDEYVNSHLSFFNSNIDRLEFVGPSDDVKERWSKLSGIEQSKFKVIYHQELKGNYPKKKCKSDDLIKIAYIGTQTINKGWKEWKDIISNAFDSRLTFYYFGQGKENLPNVTNIDVSVKRDGPTAMMDALRSHNIDIVFLGSLCPETYSYTYYEAFAANAFVLSFYFSGNIANAISQHQNGKVFNNNSELIQYLKDFEVLNNDLEVWNSSSKCGPKELVENKEMLNLVKNGKANRKNNQINKRFGFIYRNLVLEMFYRIRKM